MYLSHKYKFLFLRTPKTASSSLSEFFIKNIDDPDAIYTPVEDSNIPGTLDPAIISKYSAGWKYYHFTLEDLIKEGIITTEQMHSYTNVALMRDPIDRQKSFYYFYKKFRSPKFPASLVEYKQWAPNGYFNGEPNSAIKQADFLTFDDVVCGDYWLYENLNDELESLMDKLGLEIKHPLPRHKTNSRKDRSNEIAFDSESVVKLKEVFKDDFDLYMKLRLEQHEN